MPRAQSRERIKEALPPTPDPALRGLDKLVGTWNLRGRDLVTEGEISGQVSFDWLEGRFFLVQHVDIDHAGKRVAGIEVIGHERKWGEEPGRDLHSRFFDNSGNTLDYIYEVGEDTIVIWGGEVGSPAVFRGRFSEDRATITGKWEWPGGGYEATLKKVM